MEILVVADLHMDMEASNAIAKASRKFPVTFVAGDIGLSRSEGNYRIFDYMSKTFKSSRTYITPGNHDFWPVNIVKIYGTSHDQNIRVVVDRSVTIFDGNNSIKVWFSPWSKQFADWNWMVDEVEEDYNIPSVTDIVVTHGPAMGFHDELLSGESVGSYELYESIDKTLARAVFSGHIHGNKYGSMKDSANRIWQNVSVLDESYRFKGELVVYDTESNETHLINEQCCI